MVNKSSHFLQKQRLARLESKEKTIESLNEKLSIGQIFYSLTQNEGWKHLLRDYLDERCDPQRLVGFLEAPTMELRKEGWKMLALWDLMAYINQKIKEGEMASRKLKELT